MTMYTVIVENVNLKLLTRQRSDLLELAGDASMEEPDRESVNGVVSLLDAMIDNILDQEEAAYRATLERERRAGS